MKNSKKLIDLHIHSSYSDGDLKPLELVNLAKLKGIDTISITDHDTLLGNIELQKHALKKTSDIKVISGIELSAKTTIGRMHILGYGIDIFNKSLNDKMNELKTNSVNSVLSVIEQIKKDYGIIFSYEELKGLITAERNIGRPDIAILCVKNNYATSVQDAFDKYLIEAYSKTRQNNPGIMYEECIDLILKSGGIPVLAHPHTLKRNDIELLKLIKEMIQNGLQGIEVYHSNNTLEETIKYNEIAKQLDLLISGGTDYHGFTVKPDIEIGTGRKNNIEIKELSLIKKII